LYSHSIKEVERPEEQLKEAFWLTTKIFPLLSIARPVCDQCKVYKSHYQRKPTTNGYVEFITSKRVSHLTSVVSGDSIWTSSYLKQVGVS